MGVVVDHQAKTIGPPYRTAANPPFLAQGGRMPGIGKIGITRALLGSIDKG
jgi:hypothetical protein